MCSSDLRIGGTRLGFFDWMAIGLPVVIIMFAALCGVMYVVGARGVTMPRGGTDAVREELRQLRDGWHEKQNAAHERELRAHDLQSRLESVAARIRDDYGLELAELASGGRESPEGFESPEVSDSLGGLTPPRSPSSASSIP